MDVEEKKSPMPLKEELEVLRMNGIEPVWAKDFEENLRKEELRQLLMGQFLDEAILVGV